MKSQEEAQSATLHRSRSAGRVLALLDAVVVDGPITLTHAAEQVGVPASTALRHLRVLVEHGYVHRDRAGHYAAGPTTLRLGLAALRSGPFAELIAAAQPGLERLARESEESAYLAVRDGTEAVYISTVEGTRAIRHVGWVGRSVPIVGTAVGDALDAAAAGTTPQVFVNVGAIESDVAAVVAPIHGSSGVLGAFSVLGPASRIRGAHRRAIVDAVADVAATTADLLSA